MREFFPLLVTGGVIGFVALLLFIAYLTIRGQKEAIGFDRNMKDGEIVKRLIKYAKPHWKSFLLILLIMIFSVAYDVISPLIVGHIEQLIVDDFPMSKLLAAVAVYAGILVVSLVCSYFQAILLQKIGQKILSKIREDLFVHIESLFHLEALFQNLQVYHPV